MGKEITELASYVQPLCQAFLDKAEAAGIPCLLVDTGRTRVEQSKKIKDGVSWTSNSMHLPQKPEDLSEAFDAAPKEYLGMKNWNPTGPLWARLGKIGKALGLKWGGDWVHHPDPSHWEYDREREVATLTTT